MAIIMDGKKKSETDLEQALLDPASVFSSPTEVIEAERFSKAEKIEILRRWEYDASEEGVAAEEGMGEGEGELLQKIVVALQSLTETLNLDHTPPTKQGGIDRSAVKIKR